jgi:phosphatidylserine/phosphatidylglycerophosphate/cardiolipin synthase-like enzyme
MIRILKERAKAGVEIRMLGKLQKKDLEAKIEKFPGKLHARVIIQDGRKAFIGSQSLRRLELDERREVGVVFTDAPVVKELVKTFESDWSETDSGRKEAEEREKQNRSRSRKRKKKR